MYMTNLFVLVSIFLLFVVNNCVCVDEEDFSEELVLSDLGNGYSYFGFNFVFTRQVNDFNFVIKATSSHKHFNLFPRSISDLAARFRVSEFHLTLSQGYWNHAAWGYASQPQPQGAELWAWLGSHGSESDKVESNWREFVSAVSGMFCASVNAMATGAVATSPAWSYRPEGLSQRGREPRTLRLAQIVNQGVCTENLTPWSRLLPCKKQAGIGQLLNAVKLHDSAYNSVQVHFKPTHRGLALRLAFTAVIDRRIAQLGKADWSVHSLLSRAVSLPCSLATGQTGSRLLVLKRTAPDPDQSAVQPEPLQSYNLANGLKLLDYNLTKMLDDEAKDSVDVKFNFPWTWVPVERLQSPPVVAQKYQIGTGSEMGGVVVAISNRHPSQAINVIILEIVPWQLRMLFHTLELTLGDNLAHKANKVHYQQSVDRVRPAKLELLVTVPPRTSLRVSYRFTKQLVRWNEFPPDANHGLYLPPTVVSFVAPSDSSLRLPVLPQTVLSIAELTANRNATTPEPIFVRLYTEALLVNAPKPDFSMPYNVLCLVCTVLAIGSGFMHNVACKLASVSNPNPADKDATLMGRLKKMLTPWRRQ
ncbi:hypothetical protein BOX15_Mlig001107g3 [Macrostomum lignano]|uniref:GPI transamidase component PIG-T n=1 Tax=Macrostomum lignano TaxID=282301 RepID=A0A267ESC3_9PLAT|nr:hypothetical protein BOX15_Mlig001107g3 [Macrostomum lignano]